MARADGHPIVPSGRAGVVEHVRPRWCGCAGLARPAALRGAGELRRGLGRMYQPRRGCRARPVDSPSVTRTSKPAVGDHVVSAVRRMLGSDALSSAGVLDRPGMAITISGERSTRRPTSTSRPTPTRTGVCAPLVAGGRSAPLGQRAPRKSTANRVGRSAGPVAREPVHCSRGVRQATAGRSTRPAPPRSTSPAAQLGDWLGRSRSRLDPGSEVRQRLRAWSPRTGRFCPPSALDAVAVSET